MSPAVCMECFPSVLHHGATSQPSPAPPPVIWRPRPWPSFVPTHTQLGVHWP